jgi:hypothetical protein
VRLNAKAFIGGFLFVFSSSMAGRPKNSTQPEEFFLSERDHFCLQTMPQSKMIGCRHGFCARRRSLSKSDSGLCGA